MGVKEPFKIKKTKTCGFYKMGCMSSKNAKAYRNHIMRLNKSESQKCFENESNNLKVISSAIKKRDVKTFDISDFTMKVHKNDDNGYNKYLKIIAVMIFEVCIPKITENVTMINK